MLTPLVLALLVPPLQEQLPPSPIVRIEVSPAQPVVVAQDSLQLQARALDAAGREVPNAQIRFVGAGARFEAVVSGTGMVVSGATGRFPVSVIATVPGTSPRTERVEVAMVPGPAARISIGTAPTKLVNGQRSHLRATVYSRHDDVRDDRVVWRSSAPAVARIGADGILTAVGPGRAVISASVGAITSEQAVTVEATPIRSMTIEPTTREARTGDVIRFRLDVTGTNGARLDGLTPTWTIAPGHGLVTDDGAFVGYQAGEYTVVANLGDRSAVATVRLAARDVRRPVEIVGRLPRSAFTTEEVWVHPNGVNLYLGTGGGGDRMYAIDIRNPAQPVITDSLVANTRRVNDMMTTPDGKFLVHTREGAADRRNGIVIASLEDPAHPKVIAEFTEGVTAGVHSAFIYRQERFGTHVYATNNGTGAMHIIDITDPYQPKETARFRVPGPMAGNALHDIDVQDGLAYLSNWNNGLIIIDIGHGLKGGSPSNPQIVSQFKYDLNEMYRDVEATTGPGFIRGTHTAWRHKNYVFIADEVFPAENVKGAKDAAAGRAFGRLQVIDVSDIEKPKSVAWYEPEFGGVHNVWVAGDTLYMGAYNAGFRTFDISGELLGDLRSQQREMAHVNTADLDGMPASANTAMTWGVVVRDGLAYVNDMYSGLWIIRMLPKTPKVIIP